MKTQVGRSAQGGLRKTAVFWSRFLPALLAGFVFWTARDGACALEPHTARSRSGQFTVRGLPIEAPPQGSTTLTNLSFVRLDPAVLVVSCERIKNAVLGALGLRDQWRGRVFIALHPVRQDREPVFVRCMGFLDGWVYQIDMPEKVERKRLVDLVVEVVLLEIANRRARNGCVELPPWLAEGLAAHLQATSLATLPLELETRVTQVQRYADPLRVPRETLRNRPALTFDELNWPMGDGAADGHGEVYRSCAHLFVYQLLQLKGGRACLQEMLLRLPDYLNWQTAFLRSFHAYFERLLDADKWWTLHAVRFTGRDLFSTWSRGEAWRQFDAILRPPAQVRTQTNALPRNIRVTLQTAILEWDFSRQSAVLTSTINRLQALQLRAVPEVAELADEYVQTLDTYLVQHDKPRGPERLRNPLPPNPRVVAAETLRRLDELDLKRAHLRPKPGNLAEAMEGALAESRRRHPPEASRPAVRPPEDAER